MTPFETEVLARLTEIEKRLDPSTLAQAIMNAPIKATPDGPGNFGRNVIETHLTAEEMAKVKVTRYE